MFCWMGSSRTGNSVREAAGIPWRVIWVWEFEVWRGGVGAGTSNLDSPSVLSLWGDEAKTVGEEFFLMFLQSNVFFLANVLTAVPRRKSLGEGRGIERSIAEFVGTKGLDEGGFCGFCWFCCCWSRMSGAFIGRTPSRRALSHCFFSVGVSARKKNEQVSVKIFREEWTKGRNSKWTSEIPLKSGFSFQVEISLSCSLFQREIQKWNIYLRIPVWNLVSLCKTPDK